MFATTTLFAVFLAFPVLSAGRLLRRQDLSGLPPCGQNCLISAVTDSKIIGSCSISDVSCLCKNDNFQNSVQNCALSKCSSQDQVTMLTWAIKTCPAAASTTSAPQAPQAPVSTAALPSGATGLPSCGQNCLATSGSNTGIVGSCSPTDIACLCKNDNYMGTVKTCVASQCSLDDKLAMLTWSNSACSSAAASTGSTPSADAPPAKKEAPSATTSASQTIETEIPQPDSVSKGKTDPKSGNMGVAPSGTNQFSNTSQRQTPQDGSTYVTKGLKSANAGVMQGGIDQLTNTSQSTAPPNGSAYVTKNYTSGTMQGASQNITITSMNLNSTPRFTMPARNSSAAPVNTSSLPTETVSSASPENSASTPAQYAPDMSPASSIPLAGSCIGIATAVLISVTMLWMN